MLGKGNAESPTVDGIFFAARNGDCQLAIKIGRKP